MIEKLCTRCKTIRLIIDFNKNSRSKDGLQNKCKPCAAEQQKSWRLRNPDRNYKNQKGKVAEFEANFKEKYGISYHTYKRRKSLSFKLGCSLRNRFKSALKGNHKTGSAVKDLGCSINELKLYLEKQFQEGMSWENYGEWHIDHIIPLSSFDLRNPEEIKKACNYKNLRPLWALDNLKKSNKMTS